MSALESAAKGPGERSSLAQVAARGVSQRGGASRCGSESERGTRFAVEALWPSREPVRRQAQVPSKRKRRGPSREPVRQQAQVPSKRKRRLEITQVQQLGHRRCGGRPSSDLPAPRDPPDGGGEDENRGGHRDRKERHGKAVIARKQDPRRVRGRKIVD